MDISEIVGEELNAVEFVQDYVQLRFETPLVTFYAWPHILLSDFSLAYGEPEYRNALCSLTGEKVEEAVLDEGDSLTVKFENDIVIALSLREEDLDVPQAGAYSASGSTMDQEEF